MKKRYIIGQCVQRKRFISVADDDAATVPCGPFHTVLTRFEIFISKLSSAVQVKVSEDPDKTVLGESE